MTTPSQPDSARATEQCPGSRMEVPGERMKAFMQATCDHCGQFVRTVYPKGGDGSVEVYYRHKRRVPPSGGATDASERPFDRIPVMMERRDVERFASLPDEGVQGAINHRLYAACRAARAAHPADAVANLTADRWRGVHFWFDDAITHGQPCVKCGIMRRADGKNRPCPDQLPRITMREAALDGGNDGENEAAGLS